MRFGAALGLTLVALMSSWARHGRATDIIGFGASGGLTAVPAELRWSAGLPASFEANIAADVIGTRVGMGPVLGGWLSRNDGGTLLGLRPELGFFFAGDGASLRFFATLRSELGLYGWGGADAHLFEAIQIGPELEWRRVASQVARARIAFFYAPTRGPSGDWELAGGMLALAVEYGFMSLPAVVVPSDCIELPTRPCAPQ
jgi:hypothetical protein